MKNVLVSEAQEPASQLSGERLGADQDAHLNIADLRRLSEVR
jgi:hypothetical protein